MAKTNVELKQENKAAEESADIEEVVFRIKVNNINDLGTFVSRNIYVRGQRWNVRVLKNETDLSVFLYSQLKEIPANSAIIAYFDIELISRKTQAAKRQFFGHAFRPSTISGWGFVKFISWAQLTDPELGYVEDDTCEFKIKLNVGPLHDIMSNDIMKMDIFDHCSNGTFRFTVNDIREFVGISSSELILCGVPWQIVLIKSLKYKAANEDLENNHLHVQLQYQGNDIPSFRTTMICKIIPFGENLQSVNKQFKNLLFDKRNESKELDIISWSDLTNAESRFIENDKFVVEVKLEIVKWNAAMKTEAKKRKAVELECSICFESMIDREPSTLRCGHMFCKECITKSLQRRKNCPFCNKKALLGDLLGLILPTK